MMVGEMAMEGMNGEVLMGWTGETSVTGETRMSIIILATIPVQAVRAVQNVKRIVQVL
jgi:hypothetical protein